MLKSEYEYFNEKSNKNDGGGKRGRNFTARNEKVARLYFALCFKI